MRAHVSSNLPQCVVVQLVNIDGVQLRQFEFREIEKLSDIID